MHVHMFVGVWNKGEGGERQKRKYECEWKPIWTKKNVHRINAENKEKEKKREGEGK